MVAQQTIFMVNDKEQLKPIYMSLLEIISLAMFQHDLIDINYGSNTDEYDSEAGTVIPRLPECHSETDVAKVLNEEYVRWFGVEDAGNLEAYQTLAKEIWQLWQQERYGK